MPSPLQTIRKGEEEFKHKFEGANIVIDRSVPTSFINNQIETNKQTLKATLQALWDEAEGRKYPPSELQYDEDTKHHWHNNTIQTYQDSLLELIKAI